jgi:hypothetical protein
MRDYDAMRDRLDVSAKSRPAYLGNSHALGPYPLWGNGTVSCNRFLIH